MLHGLLVLFKNTIVMPGVPRKLHEFVGGLAKFAKVWKSVVCDEVMQTNFSKNFLFLFY